MRFLTLAAAMALAATPAMADLYSGYSTTGRSPGAPLDRGPYTSQADRAYAGGGLVLEGAPGAPAPMPQQTAPAGSIAPDRAFRDRMASSMPERMASDPMPYGGSYRGARDAGGMSGGPTMRNDMPRRGMMRDDMSQQGMMPMR